MFGGVVQPLHSDDTLVEAVVSQPFQKEPTMSLGALQSRKPVTVEPHECLAKAARLMRQEGVGAVVVAELGRPVGILTDRDLGLAVCLDGAAPHDAVQTHMTCPVETIRNDEGVYSATQKMMELAVRRLPVVDNIGRLVGLVSLDDLLSLLSRELRNGSEGVRAEVATL
jgi:signal-transduction protein with cAMP-binding, CBS, and nucleotidyltransferase domain